MVKTRITDAGIIQEPGDGFEGTPFTPTTFTRSADTTLVANDAGVNVITASTVPGLTMSLPAASTAAGRLFVFRSTSPGAHLITASADAGATISTPFTQYLANVTGSNGSALQLAAFAGASAALLCTGANWLVVGASGSITFQKGF